MSKHVATLIAAFIIAIAAPALESGAAPSDKPHDHGQTGHGAGHMDHQNMSGGGPGDVSQAKRTIVIVMKDTEFNLKTVQVKADETVKFVIKNKGELVHEFTIGNPEMQKMHQAEMMKMMEEGKLMADKVAPGVVHGHPNTALVEPGKTKEVVWKFAKDDTLEFGCNVPGHYEQGMKGRFQFTN